MQEILFSAKRIDNGYTVCGYHVKDGVTGKHFIVAEGSMLHESDKVGEEGLLNFVAFEVDEDTISVIGNGWIPVDELLPEDGMDVLVVLKPTYESDYIEYSIARYLRFENDEAHWCDNHYGYLEWDKYSDGHGGSSWYRVVAWQKLDSYHPERSDNHDE